MLRTPARLVAWSLIIGTVVATAGYLTAFLANGNGDARFAGSSWTAFYTIALFGDVLVVAGLPALLHVHGERQRKLTMIGYVGVLIPLVILNVGEGCIEGFVKPYLATHGGLPSHDLPGLAAWEAPGLLIMLVGMICLGVGTWRAGVLPRWVAVLFVVTPLLGAVGISGAAGLIPDYLLFVSLFTVGVHALRSGHQTAPAAMTPALATTA
jgi:hypothetical protein